MTFRAVEVLKTVSCIVAEDTRHSQYLLQHYAIQTPAIPLHEHNERERAAVFIERLQRGESIACPRKGDDKIRWARVSHSSSAVTVQMRLNGNSALRSSSRAS